MAEAQLIVALVAMSVLPPLAFLLWIRTREKFEREPYRRVLGAFAFGGTIGVIVAFLLNTLFGTAAQQYNLGIEANFLTTVMIAPLVEEVTKGMGLATIRGQINEWEDGIIYGAAIGLGFAATENILYGLTSLLDEGGQVAIFTVIVRTFSSTILHAATTMMLGFGYGYLIIRDKVAFHLLPYYLLAVALHAAYNFLVSIGQVVDNGLFQLAGLVFAVALVWSVLGSMNRRIKALDALPHEQHVLGKRN